MIIFFSALFYFSSLDKSITAAGHGAGSSRRRPCWYPPSLGAPSHTLITQRPGWDWTSNLWTREAALLPLSHRSLVGACAGTYISLFSLTFYNKPVKFWTHWTEVWTHDTTAILSACNVCLAISATLSFTSKAGVCTSLLEIMQYMSFNVSKSGARTQDSTIPTQHSVSWATEADELMVVWMAFIESFVSCD